MKQLVSKHSSRKFSLNDSMNGLTVGYPGREKSKITFFYTPTYRLLTKQTLSKCKLVFEEEFDCVRE